MAGATEVTDLLRQRGLPFEERVVTGNRALMEEMVRKSGQTKAPVVEIDGHLLVDTDADEVERYLNASPARPASVVAPGGGGAGDREGPPGARPEVRVMISRCTGV